ncbi:MAG TPA: RnfABCDGE type electron transport complex subunit D [Acidimicrobiales bacterium]|nr:RnfABCDGE type electron transport complex subunit D [Acidimicrobiales bacterium]
MPPSVRDARLHVAAVLLTVQVLGQTVVDWDLSIAQVLTCLVVAAGVEVAVVARRDGVLAWPASALLTGNGVALLLRVPGTEHGDWWTMRGAHLFAVTTALAVLSKRVLRVDDRPLFNPSNLGLVACFLVVGVDRAEPQDLWWGPWDAGLALTYAVIVGGFVVITRRLGLLEVAIAFLASFGAVVAAVVLAGHAITARWHVGAVDGAELWRTIVLSPETMVFAGFMITDPRTVPVGRGARLAFAVVVGVLSGVLLAPQETEATTKVAILAGLIGACAARPLLERRLPRVGRPAIASPVVGAILVVAAAALTTPGRDDAPAVERPAVDLGPLPTIEVDDGGEGVALPDDPERIAVDVLEDLALEADALRTQDPALAATAATGRRLAQLEAAMEAHAEPPASPVEPDRLKVQVRPDPEDGQAPPQVSVVVEAGDRRWTYVVTEVGGHWLLAAETRGA